MSMFFQQIPPIVVLFFMAVFGFAIMVAYEICKAKGFDMAANRILWLAMVWTLFPATLLVIGLVWTGLWLPVLMVLVLYAFTIVVASMFKRG